MNVMIVKLDFPPPDNYMHKLQLLLPPTNANVFIYVCLYSFSKLNQISKIKPHFQFHFLEIQYPEICQHSLETYIRPHSLRTLLDQQ